MEVVALLLIDWAESAIRNRGYRTSREDTLPQKKHPETTSMA
jgi:hypothetical protein